MAFQGHPTGPPMRHMLPGMPPPPGGMYPHPSFGHHPPPMMMMSPMGQHAPQGLIPPPGMPLSTPPRHMMMMAPGQVMPLPVPMIGSEPIIKVPIPTSMANMKVATTVFVGNISEKASDTLIRQILLRCGPIEGWKRVQDATGKLQGFGFCEYADPDSTLRALRLLHDLKLGEKSLVAKVDAKTRKDLLKYLITKKHSKNGQAAKEEVEKEVAKLEEDKDVATAALISEVPEQAKSEDNRINDAINTLLKDYRSILSVTKSNEDIQRERDVKESILFMAKQSGNIDPNTSLEDMDMEDDMKTLVSDEIKRFRESYKRSDEARKEKKPGFRSSEKDEGGPRAKEKESSVPDELPPLPPLPSSSKRKERSRSPTTRSPRRRVRSPVRSRSQERQEKEKRREALRLKEREDTFREEEEHEERVRQRRIREREKSYRARLMNWEGRERRKEKEYEKELKREKERREDMEKEKKHLGDFLAEYDDNRDDHKYYKGSAYSRRRREREMEIVSDRRDRIREQDEIEELRLQVIERQAQEMLSGDAGRRSSGEDESPVPEDDDMDVPVKELDEDIPLTKTGYSVPPAYPPIQVHSAPKVNVREGSSELPSVDSLSLRLREEELKQEHSEGTSPASYSSPTQPKLAFGLKKATTPNQSLQSNVPAQEKSKLDNIFPAEDDDLEQKPKKKLVPIDYSDEEEEEEGIGNGHSPESSKKHSRRSSGKGRSGKGSGNIGIVMRGASLSICGDDMTGEDGRERKLSTEDRKKLVQSLVNNIPTAKEEVFQYQLKWDQIDKGLIEKRIGPWINKKITEYIGESEPILTEFICNKLSCHIAPSDILEDIAMVLDDEAEVFIVKLWRLLIYETEAKHLGIQKKTY